ncbi:MAG: energy-coupling factor ABC transporter permease [Archaeoglobaceae archaeon]|nr:energy-coupling factor ABC transporter permease [Archaeoglobaceae archaeon]MCX8152492.1 energy-coupling factor ABC transporter permease [Archaeoglobaceae archaeon]MDW8013693.1 energy-coupling factor ABC transporter permease [Archaeoglobaceae archaeon]
MHIAEGFLPPEWCLFWYAFSLPFIIYGAWKVKKEVEKNPKSKSLLAISAGFIFVLSALKIPSVTGSCSHPTGTGIAVILFGPVITAFLSFIVLLYQALLLAHGGITTLGANTAAMGIIAPFFSFFVYKIVKKYSVAASFFAAAATADLTTYIVTSFQLALAFPSTAGFEGVISSMYVFVAIFAVTQIPIAVIEAFLALALLKNVVRYEVVTA